MKHNRLFRFLFLALMFNSLLIFAQEKPYWKEVQAFKKIDQENRLPRKPILLLGSSSFTYWKDVNDYFPNKRIVNRAFGGSRLVDLNYYADDLLDPYKPRQILIYCGENDIAMEDPTASEVFERFKTFFHKIRTKYPRVPVGYVAIKYSPSREKFWPVVTQVNQMIEDYLKTQKRAEFIDITKIMNDENGNVRGDIFVEDRLHMNAKGYQLWTQVMEPYLK